MKFFRFSGFLVFCLLGTLQFFESGAKEKVSVGAKATTKAGLPAASSSVISSKLAIISLGDVAKNSKAGQSIDKQIEEINNKSKEDLLELENSIKKMDSDAKTSSDETKVGDLQVILYDMVKEKRYQIQAAYRSAIGILNEEIHRVVKEIADERGYSLVVPSDAVVYSSSECPDITEEVTKRLDNEISKIKVDMTKKDPAER